MNLDEQIKPNAPAQTRENAADACPVAVAGPVIVRNLWHRADSAYSQPTYRLTTRRVFRHRGVEVYRVPAGGYLHVLAGAAIAHRVGCDRTGAVIDGLLDGTDMCSDAVAAHLREQGFSPLSHSDYSKQLAAEFSDNRL